MNATLEARYRRLLVMYPAEHRRKHQDEMLGVLMTGARAGQLRPGVRDTANLIWGALLIRLRPARRDTAWPLWRDALAVVSVLLPLIVAAYSALPSLAALASHAEGTSLVVFAVVNAQTLGGWLILAVLTLLRLRRTAMLTAAALLIWLAYMASFQIYWGYLGATSMVTLAAAGLELAALVASAGPARAMQILGWQHYAAALAIPLGLAAAVHWLWPDHLAVSAAIVITVCAMPLAGLTLASPLGKRVATLLALPAYYLIVYILTPPPMIGGPYVSTPGSAGPLRITLSLLPLAVLLCVAFRAALAGRPAHPGQRPAILGLTQFRAFASALGEMLEKGQDAGNPRMHVITGPGGHGYNPDDNQYAHDPAQYLSQHAFPLRSTQVPGRAALRAGCAAVATAISRNLAGQRPVPGSKLITHSNAAQG